MDDALSIIDYTPQHKQALEDISLPWLLEYDLLEPVDLEMPVSYTHLRAHET